MLGGPAEASLSFRAILDDAVRYWELRRIGYNLALTTLVLYADLVMNQGEMLSYRLILLVFLAVVANLCYTTAYIPDLALQYSSFRPYWLKLRPLLFIAGTGLACLLAYQAVFELT